MGEYVVEFPAHDFGGESDKNALQPQVVLCIGVLPARLECESRVDAGHPDTSTPGYRNG